MNIIDFKGDIKPPVNSPTWLQVSSEWYEA